MKKLILILVAMTTLSMSAIAQQRSERDRKPPKEAIEACQNKSEGDSVSFETRRGDTLSGTCQTINDSLVAVPEGHAERKKQKQH